MSRREVNIWPEGYAEAIDIDVRTLKAIISPSTATASRLVAPSD